MRRIFSIVALILAGLAASGCNSTKIAPVTLASIGVTAANSSIPPGTSQQFVATGMYSDGSKQDLTGAVTWSSSASIVATVTPVGLANGIGFGTTTISATSGSVIGSTTLTVTAGFVLTGSMTSARLGHTATELNNGKVLIAGGESTGSINVASAELYDSLTGIFMPTGSMNKARVGHIATLLNNGKVLVVGPDVSAELYDPTTGTFTLTGSLASTRLFFTATLLTNGKVLIVGGGSVSAELYDPVAGTFASTGSLNTNRFHHTATLLNDGKVLIAGGELPSVAETGLNSAELYDPSNGTFTPTGNLTISRSRHTATLLNGGKVFLAGGTNCGGVGVGCSVLTSAELYDPATGTFTPTGAMSVFRIGDTATLLTNGKVVIAGGDTNFGQPSAVGTAELYDPASGSFTFTGNMTGVRNIQTATLLNDGNVMLAGGTTTNAPSVVLATAELYNPSTMTPTGLISLTVSPLSPSIALGISQRFSAEGTFTNSGMQTMASVIWRSSNSTVETISNDSSNQGSALAVGLGTVTISASAGSVSGSTTLTAQ